MMEVVKVCAKVVLCGWTKIEILRDLDKCGEYKCPRGGWWNFFCRFGHRAAYAKYFYRHMQDLIDDGYVEFKSGVLRITEKGKKLLQGTIENTKIYNCARVIMND